MKQTFQMHLYARLTPKYMRAIGEPEYSFRLMPWADMADKEMTYIGPVSTDADVPENFDPRAAKLAALQAEQVQVRAEMSARITDLQRQINELQALEAA